MARAKRPRVAHLFNPEHDLALAYGREGFTPPAAGRGMRADLDFLPAVWADDDDLVVVADPDRAWLLSRPLHQWLSDVEFVTLDDLGRLSRDNPRGIEIRPWGWDRALCHQLVKAGVDEQALPSTAQIDRIRTLSHRAAAIPLLHRLTAEVRGTVGERLELTTPDALSDIASQWGHFVVKAPWSSSGRGVRLDCQWPEPRLNAFVRNVIARQGSVTVEPFYERVSDFAMEFMADGEGGATYCGLSLFSTANGAYQGNLVARECEKRAWMAPEIDLDKLDLATVIICREVGEWCKGCYSGPFGVDMMVVRQDGQLMLHPCVEVNLRRTMGHVALAATSRADGMPHTMEVRYAGGRYELRFLA